MNRLKLFQHCLDNARKLRKGYFSAAAVQSIIGQLEYLIAVESGTISDRSKLDKINIGILAVREIEDGDRVLAKNIHAASAEARKMAQER